MSSTFKYQRNCDDFIDAIMPEHEQFAKILVFLLVLLLSVTLAL